jgi:hypothetical protein
MCVCIIMLHRLACQARRLVGVSAGLLRHRRIYTVEPSRVGFPGVNGSLGKLALALTGLPALGVVCARVFC